MNNVFLSEQRHQYLRSLFPELTSKQFQYLFYFSLGLTSEKISCLLGCSKKTVINQVNTIRSKLSLESTSDLRIVFLVRVITPSDYHF
ncbi:helix-turn-helix transcriptional regulator [Vibrio qingdaonensis]|uniref:helix-turn-helix transcriptional regulator n=1 Tax=Vibrio qingdaonensis TaxID=2829491 RepID=UPI0036F306F6